MTKTIDSSHPVGKRIEQTCGGNFENLGYPGKIHLLKYLIEETEGYHNEPVPKVAMLLEDLDEMAVSEGIAISLIKLLAESL